MENRVSKADALLRWERWASALAFFGGLAVMLYLDREYNVTSAFPLKSHPTPPFIAFLLLGTLGFPLGASLLISGLADWRRAGLSEGWPTAPGRILKSEADMRLGKGPRHIADVRYEYEVDGRRYTGSKVQFSQGNYRSNAEAQAVVGRYPVGTEVAVRYDPNDPAVAGLESSPASAMQTLWLGVIALLMPFLGYFPPFLAMMNG